MFAEFFDMLTESISDFLSIDMLPLFIVPIFLYFLVILIIAIIKGKSQ